jgi:hypothetical protein
MSQYTRSVTASAKRITQHRGWETGPYWKRVLYAIDQLGNTVVPWAWGPFGGHPDETISSALGKLEIAHGGQGKIPWKYPLAKIVAWGLQKIDPGHCINAIEHDEGEAVLRAIREG